MRLVDDGARRAHDRVVPTAAAAICPLCQSTIAVDHGAVRVVVEHSPRACAAAAVQRVRDLTAALASLHETYARYVRRLHARVDDHLAAVGAPSLAESAQLAALRRDLARLHPPPEALRDLDDRPWRFWDGERWAPMSADELDELRAAAARRGATLLVAPSLVGPLNPDEPVVVRGADGERAARRRHDEYRALGRAPDAAHYDSGELARLGERFADALAELDRRGR